MQPSGEPESSERVITEPSDSMALPGVTGVKDLSGSGHEGGLEAGEELICLY